MLTDADQRRFGDALYQCMINRQVMAPLTQQAPGITIDDAYEISRQYLARRLADSGEQLVGKKIGVTSDAVQSMLGVFEPDFGFLTDAMALKEGPVSIGHLIQPRAEAEIAFRLSRPLAGPGVTAEQVLAATESVMPCFEIVDSRIRNWEIKIEDTVADNASCGVFVVGQPAVDPADLDLAACQVTVTKNGQWLSDGLGSAVQGSPAQAVAWLANTFGARGEQLEAGDLVLSGSMVPLEPVSPGDEMTMEIPGLGSTRIEFTD